MGKSIIDFINKILDTKKFIFRLWIVLWLCLLILLVLKFCFGIWYPIVSENKTFIEICDFIDSQWIVSKIVRMLCFVFSSNLLFLSLMMKNKYSKWYYCLIFNILFLGIFLLKDEINFIGIIFEVFIIIFSIIYNCKKNKLNKTWFNILLPIVIYVVLNLWQVLILLVRGLDNANFISYPFLIQFVMQLDYYVFLTILFMEVYYMGSWTWGWFFGKSTTELKALKEAELKKKNPDKDFLETLDKAIAKKENEGK